MKTKRRRGILAQVKGYRFDRKSKERIAKVASKKAGVHAFRDRKNKKRVFRNLWTLRINAAARPLGITYSKLIAALKKAEIAIDRKVLSALAKDHPEAFARIIELVR